MNETPKAKMSDDEFHAHVQNNRRKRMARVDAMAPELRELVHAYGLHIIDRFLAAGVTKPKQIKGIVETVLDTFSPTRGTYSVQGIRTPLNAVETPSPMSEEKT